MKIYSTNAVYVCIYIYPCQLQPLIVMLDFDLTLTLTVILLYVQLVTVDMKPTPAEK